MKQKVYVETSFVSYLTSRPSRDLIIAAQQEITREWWSYRKNDFDLYASELVYEEAKRGDKLAAQQRISVLENILILKTDQRMIELAKAFLLAGRIPEKASADALHIAIATIHNIEFLLTWNCTHIANAIIQKGLSEIAQNQGYELPVICTPNELLGD